MIKKVVKKIDTKEEPVMIEKHDPSKIPTSIIISGVENNRYWDIVVNQCGMTTVLMSYHYLQNKPKDFLKERIEAHPNVKVFIDSGVYTFKSNKLEEAMSYTDDDWDNYLQKYSEFLEYNADYIFACANFDLERVVGVEKVDEWNEKYFRPLEDKGIDVCYIWHGERGYDGWETYCREHSYVGISMDSPEASTLQGITKLVNVARKHGARVHGMALTQTEILVRVPFFSCDSSVDGSSSVVVKDTLHDRTERISIEELYNRNIAGEFRTTDYETRVPYSNYKVLTVDNDNKVVWGDLYGVVKHIVKKPTVRIKAEGGKEVICTTDHSIIVMDENGNLRETKADELKVGGSVLAPSEYPSSELNFLKITAIESVSDGSKEVEVYDLSVKEYERFFANGILVHNTTWLVGQQYGELNWFNGRKMQRLDKRQWRTTYKTRLLREPFNADWDKLMNGMGGKGDTYELLRLNVIAYRLAEEHIRKRIRTKMYWLVENDSNLTLSFKNKIEDVDLPDLEWFEEGTQDNYKYYLKELHIPEDMEKEEALDLLYAFYLYTKDDGTVLNDIPTEDILSHLKNDFDIEVNSREEAIEKLREIFTDNALGKRQDYSNPSSSNRPKERESYIDDTEFETIDVSAEDISAYIPPPEDNSSSELEAYEEKLREVDITPVRDSKGRFLKGQKKIRKPKKMYSDKMPKLACDTCYKAGDCPEYKAGYVCAYSRIFKKFDTRSLEDINDAMISMVNFNLERMQRAMMFETMDGGMLTPEVSALIDQNARLLKQIKELDEAKTLVSQRRVIRGDGSEETVTSVNVGNGNGGILSAIFGGAPQNTSNSRDTSKDVQADYKVDK